MVCVPSSLYNTCILIQAWAALCGWAKERLWLSPLNDITVLIAHIAGPPLVAVLVVPHHGNGLLHKGRPGHCAVKNDVLLLVHCICRNFLLQAHRDLSQGAAPPLEQTSRSHTMAMVSSTRAPRLLCHDAIFFSWFTTHHPYHLTEFQGLKHRRFPIS